MAVQLPVESNGQIGVSHDGLSLIGWRSAVGLELRTQHLDLKIRRPILDLHDKKPSSQYGWSILSEVTISQNVYQTKSHSDHYIG